MLCSVYVCGVYAYLKRVLLMPPSRGRRTMANDGKDLVHQLVAVEGFTRREQMHLSSGRSAHLPQCRHICKHSELCWLLRAAERAFESVYEREHSRVCTPTFGSRTHFQLPNAGGLFDSQYHVPANAEP